ncbi:MAG: ribosome biogenesis GTPase YqeH [Bacilli bacterium]|nr:ribosome biogenesis GTPase YqeH [Bacilli bacterium]
MSKCIGCGVNLQTTNKEELGYTINLDNSLCERCFRIRNYNDYKFVIKDNNDYINILKDISKTNDLVVLVVDLFNISKHLEDISKYINNNILLVLTKRDILPKSCYDEKFKEYFKNYDLNIIDTVVISSNKNYNLDILYNKINEYKTSNKVYVVGFTNSGKSTLINKIIYNYSNENTVITTSNLPSTTIDSIEVKVNDDLILVDTPGLLDNGDIINYIDGKTLKRIIPNKEIKPITYQIKDKQTIIIEDLVRIDLFDMNSMTIYMANNLNIKRIYKNTEELKELKENVLYIEDDSDIVIQGLGFIKFTHKSKVIIYTKDNVSVYTRKNLI